MRDADGLALSSRNAYLSKEEREVAPILHYALDTALQRYRKGERNAKALTDTTREVLASLDAFKRAQHKQHVTLTQEVLRTQYVSLADATTGMEITDSIKDGSQGAILSAAMFLGKTRLIDNVVLPPPSKI